MDDLTTSTAQKLSAEAIGTFVLVVVGVGAAIAGTGDVVAIGLAFGIAYLAMIYAFGRISGAHLNPAVSVGAALGGRISWKDAGLYSLAQVGGGIVGGLLLAVVYVAGDTGYSFGDDELGATFFGDRGGIELGGALLVEIVLTALLVLVVLAVTDERNEHRALAPLAIGSTLAALHFMAVPLTGTSVNPARSISVALFSGGDAIVQLWLFILAPVIGAALAGLAYPAVFGRVGEPVPGSGFSFASPTATAAPDYGQPAYQQPIIQDGWQWDPQAQQWIPAQQPAQQPATQHGWAAPGDGDNRTQIRP